MNEYFGKTVTAITSELLLWFWLLNCWQNWKFVMYGILKGTPR